MARHEATGDDTWLHPGASTTSRGIGHSSTQQDKRARRVSDFSLSRRLTMDNGRSEISAFNLFHYADLRSNER